MKPLLVTSTADGTGKTAVTLALARLAQQRGASVGYMKPKGTRLQSATGKTRDEDPMLARQLLDLDAEMHQLEPVVYSPTFIEQAIRGREQPAELRERIAGHFADLAAGVDVMIVEGGGRLSTGGIVDLSDADVAELLDARVLHLSDYDAPAGVDEVLADAATLGASLEGVLFNKVAQPTRDRLTDDIFPFLEGQNVQPLGAIPYDEALSGVPVADLAESLGAEVVTKDAPTEVLIERFTVGAMGSESALTRFRRTRNAAVITGADRTDIGTTALEATGVRCLVLTGGYRPNNTLLGKAEDRGVPVLLVNRETRPIVDAMEGLLHTGRTRNRETIERMEELLVESVDIDGLLGLAEGSPE